MALEDAFNPETGPETRKSQATRQKVLAAAARCFRDKGYAATRLSDIADEAGMKAGSIYYHFESKEQMLEEVFEIGMQAVFEAVEAAVGGLGPAASYRDRLRAAIKAHMEQLLEQGDFTSANIRIFGQVPEDIQRRHLKIRRHYGDYWRDLLEAARAAGELRADADLSLVRMLLLGALNWSVEWYDPAKKPAGAIADEMAEMLFRGVCE